MVPNPTPTTFIMLTLGFSALIFIVFLPTLLELKRPKDAGPRNILGNDATIRLAIRNILMANVEEEHGFDQTLAKKIANIIAFLPNLES